eukprot:GSChrysophyteH2.ASY1.ANO1.771.1 assembled CDS
MYMYMYMCVCLNVLPCLTPPLSLSLSLSHTLCRWNVSYLYLHGIDFKGNSDRCPVTMSAIQNTVSRHYSHAMFSAMAPGTHITCHYGPTNKKLRCHLPLICPCRKACAWLRVADRTVQLVQGQCIVFDDRCVYIYIYIYKYI